jgi:hypothetical protein
MSQIELLGCADYTEQTARFKTLYTKCRHQLKGVFLGLCKTMHDVPYPYKNYEVFRGCMQQAMRELSQSYVEFFDALSKLDQSSTAPEMQERLNTTFEVGVLCCLERLYVAVVDYNTTRDRRTGGGGAGGAGG